MNDKTETPNEIPTLPETPNWRSQLAPRYEQQQQPESQAQQVRNQQARDQSRQM